MTGSDDAPPNQSASRGTRIFLSYRRDDSAGHTGRLRDRLVEAFGADQVFMDLHAVSPGDDFVATVKDAIAGCGVVLAVIGRDWLARRDGHGRRLDDPSDIVRLEIATALEYNVPIVPILVQSASMPRIEELPDPVAGLATRNAMELSDSRWDYDTGRIIDAVGLLTRQRRWTRRAFRTVLAAASVAVAVLTIIAITRYGSTEAPSEGQPSAAPAPARRPSEPPIGDADAAPAPPPGRDGTTESEMNSTERFLRDRGFLDPAAKSAEGAERARLLASAVTRFQRSANLTPTGRMDASTEHLMRQLSEPAPTLRTSRDDVRKKAIALVKAFDTPRERKYGYADVTVEFNDLKYGSHQSSMSNDALPFLIRQYCAQRKAAYAAGLEPFLPRLWAGDQTLRQDQELHRLLRAAGSDPAMMELQDWLGFDGPWSAALETAAEFGLRAPLSLALLFDSRVDAYSRQSEAGRRLAVTQAIGGTPLAGVAEQTWVKAYLDERRNDIRNYLDPKQDNYRAVMTRLDAFEGLIASGNWNLTGTVTVNGHRIVF